MKDQLEALIIQMYKSSIQYSESVREFKKRFIVTVLQDNQGNRCKAARRLGMHRNTLSRAIAELDVDVKGLRAARDGRSTLIWAAPAGRLSRVEPARPTGRPQGQLMQYQAAAPSKRILFAVVRFRSPDNQPPRLTVGRTICTKPFVPDKYVTTGSRDSFGEEIAEPGKNPCTALTL